MIRRLLARLLTGRRANAPRVYAPDKHPVRRDQLSAAARSVTRRLQDEGFKAFIVGGAVRDLLLGIEPKDFDIATDATPEQVKPLFRRAFIIGRRFRLVHVHVGNDVIEVSTFRAAQTGNDTTDEHGRLLSDNVYGSQAEDAVRRDFTANALYFDPATESIWDYVGGVVDIRARRLKLIGPPVTRYREDPVRMLRAVRLAAKLGLAIDQKSQEPIVRLAPLMANVPPARLFDELCKLLLQGHATGAWELLQRYELADTLFPDHNTSTRSLDLIRNAMEGTDQRIREDKPVTPGFLIAVLLWDSYRERLAQHSDAMPLVEARESASTEVLRDQNEIAAIPRRFAQFVREVWLFQPRLETPPGNGVGKLVAHPRFRASYDFLLLRASVGEVEQELADWWTNYQAGDEQQRSSMSSAIEPAKGKRRRRRRRRGAA